MFPVKRFFIVIVLLLSYNFCYAQIFYRTIIPRYKNPNFGQGKYLEVGVEDDYTIPNFKKLSANINTIAIVPIELSILPDDKSNTKEAELRELAFKEAYNARQMLYSFMVAERYKKKSHINLQNIVTTDSILYQNGIFSDNIGQFTAKELAGLLGVDGVIITKINRKEKIAQPNLLLDNIVTATFALFKSGVVHVSAYDGHTDKLTWYYKREISEGIGSETNQIMLAIMQRTAVFFPYFKL